MQNLRNVEQVWGVQTEVGLLFTSSAILTVLVVLLRAVLPPVVVSVRDETYLLYRAPIETVNVTSLPAPVLNMLLVNVVLRSVVKFPQILGTTWCSLWARGCSLLRMVRLHATAGPSSSSLLI